MSAATPECPLLTIPTSLRFFAVAKAKPCASPLFSLIDRGLLTLKSSGTSVISPGGADTLLEVKDPRAIDNVKRPIEKSVLEAFKTAKPVSSTLDLLAGCTACFDYAVSLEKLGLLADPHMRSARRRRFLFAIGTLLGVAGLKILMALLRGRTNILFLIILAGLAAYLTSRTSNPFRTARGEKFLEDVKSLFQFASSSHRFASSWRCHHGSRLVGVRLRAGGNLPHSLSASDGSSSEQNQSADLESAVGAPAIPPVARSVAAAQAAVAVAAEDVGAVVVAEEAAVAVAGAETMKTFVDKVGLGWRADLAAGILSHLDGIDLLEVIADDFFDASSL